MDSRAEPDPGLSAIMSERRQLINLAYRLLGSLAEAEDAVQETYARWYAMSRRAAGRHRIARRLADHGRQPHLPGPARLGPGPAGALRRRVAPRAAARIRGSGHRVIGRRHGRPGRPGHPRRVGQHGVPGRARVDDPGRARRVHPARRLPLPLRRGGRDRRPHPGGVPPAGLLGPPPGPRRRRPPPTPTARQAGIVRDFKQAWEAQDIDALIGLLDPDATVIADGGGLASAALHPIEGGEQVARYLARPRRPGTRRPDPPGTHGQRPARPGRPAGRRHRDRVRVRHRRRPDQAHLGRPQPRQAPPLDRTPVKRLERIIPGRMGRGIAHR